MERGTSTRVAEARIRPQTADTSPRIDRNVRFAPERSAVLSRQHRILHGPSIIEVPQNMYERDSILEFDRP